VRECIWSSGYLRKNELGGAVATQVTNEDLLKLEIKFSELAERRRNEAIAVFAGIGVLLSVLGYFGFQQIAKQELERFAKTEIMVAAEAARDKATQAASIASDSSDEVARILVDLKAKASVPPGTVVAWFPEPNGSPLDERLPRGWLLCDGKNGTPDLTGRFILGTSKASTIGGAGGSTKHTHSGRKTGSRFEATNQGSRGTGATRHDDNQIIVDEVESLPPYVSMAYIMKQP
jgi:hypothetical protein